MAPALAARVNQFGGPEVLVIQPGPELGAPRPGEVKVAVRAAAVTPLDTYLRAGLKVGGYSPQPPYTPGSAFAGTIVAVGDGVPDLHVGQRVFGQSASGSYAEIAICSAARLHTLPDSVGYAEGALVAVPFRTAFHALFDLASAAGGETVLVQGASGSVGAAAVQLARSAGLQVIATANLSMLGAVLSDGAHAAVDRKDPQWQERVREAAEGRQVNIIIEIAASANLASDLDLAAPGGRIVVVGGHGVTPIDPLPIIGKGLAVFGVSLPNITPDRDAQIMAAVVAGLENRTLRPRVNLTFPFEDVAAAHEAVAKGLGSGGVALLFNE